MLINKIINKTVQDELNRLNIKIVPTTDSGHVFFVQKPTIGKAYVKHTYLKIGNQLNNGWELGIHHSKDFDKPRLEYVHNIRKGRIEQFDEDYSDPYNKTEAIKRAFDLMCVGSKYDELTNNCHMFTNDCCYGVRKSKAVQNLVTVAFGIGICALLRA